MDLAFNNLERLICHKTQTTNQPTNQPTKQKLYFMKVTAPLWINALERNICKLL